MRPLPDHPAIFEIPAPRNNSNGRETTQASKKWSEVVYAPGISYQSGYPIIRAIRIVASNPIKQNRIAELAAC